MKIVTKINRRDFLVLQFRLVYSKAIIIGATILGLIQLIAPVLHYSGILKMDHSPATNIALGLFMVFGIPLFSYFPAAKQFISNRRIQETIEYEFTTEKLIITGESFNSIMEWKSTYKIKELKGWFLIYQSARVFNPIPLTSLTDSQITGIRDLLGGLYGIKLKLRKNG